GRVIQLAAGAEHTCALREDGHVMCWGHGPWLGSGTSPDRTTPFLVPDLESVTAVHAHLGQHTCVELRDLSARCWGANESGQIGDGTFNFAAAPTNVLLQ